MLYLPSIKKMAAAGLGYILGSAFGGNKDEPDAVASNTVRNIVNFNTQIINSNVQVCDSRVDVTQIIDIQDISGDNVFISTNQEQQISMAIGCLFSASTENSISNEIGISVKQIAEAIDGGIFTDPPATQNITELVTNLSNTIVNEYINNCSTTLTANQKFSAGGIKGKTIAISENQVVNDEIISNCIGSSANVTDVVNKLEIVIDQFAKSESKSVAAMLFWTIIALSVLLFIFFVGIKMITGPKTFKTIMSICILVVVITGCAIALYFTFTAGKPPDPETTPLTPYDDYYNYEVGGFACKSNVDGVSGIRDPTSGHCVANVPDVLMPADDPWLACDCDFPTKGLKCVCCGPDSYYHFTKDMQSADPFRCDPSPDGGGSKRAKGAKVAHDPLDVHNSPWDGEFMVDKKVVGENTIVEGFFKVSANGGKMPTEGVKTIHHVSDNPNTLDIWGCPYLYYPDGPLKKPSNIAGVCCKNEETLDPDTCDVIEVKAAKQLDRFTCAEGELTVVPLFVEGISEPPPPNPAYGTPTIIGGCSVVTQKKINGRKERFKSKGINLF
jgi:hypothetical protein